MILAKHTLKLLISCICILILVAFLRLFLFEIYFIPSNSMLPTLIRGDYVFVSKIAYGPRIVRVWKILSEKKIDYIKFKGINSPKVKDILVFNWPDYTSLHDNFQVFFGKILIKRCYGSNGDTIIINHKSNELIDYNNGKQFLKTVKDALFPQDSTLNWTIYKYGPLWVPKKGITIKLTTNVSRHYANVLLYEGYKTKNCNDSVLLNDEFTEQYTFKENYYFMLGDNFYSSNDSRYWGFLPEKNIVGKAVLVLFSLDPYKPWHKKFRWNRFLKKIE